MYRYPGPLQYLPQLDAFVTVSTGREAQCFRYQVLANSHGDINNSGNASGADASGKTGAFGLSAMRSALMEWSVQLGETCLAIVPGYFSGAEHASVKRGQGRGHISGSHGQNQGGELLLVCERSLFLVKESGGVLQQRRLEKAPMCVCRYQSGQQGLDSFLLANQDGTVQVFNKFNLVWAAKAEAPPVCLQVSQFAEQAGLVVQLSDSGRLSISFLGTKPPLTIASSTTSRDLDYDKIDAEHRSLLQVRVCLCAPRSFIPSLPPPLSLTLFSLPLVSADHP